MAKNSETAKRNSALEIIDPEIQRAIAYEKKRQHDHVELIASENFSSRAVREAVGSVLTDKYAEGYPGNRWYGGCEWVDVVEKLAIDRACKLFGSEYANVQPHAGSQANMAVLMAVLPPGSKILGMSLAHGGHLTHGHSCNFSGDLYNVVSYGVEKQTAVIDYEKVMEVADSEKPDLIIAGASAYSRFLDFKKFREIADSVGAFLLVDMAHIAGLVAAGLHPDPVPYADFVTSTTHKTLRGPRGGFILAKNKFAKRINTAVFPGIQGGPLMHIIAGKAVAFREAATPEFMDYQKQVIINAKAMAGQFLKRGISVVSGGTDNHLMLLDLTALGFSGQQAADWLDLANITVNKNAIPFDKRNPSEAGGIRIGTPAMTSRGIGKIDAVKIADWVSDILLSGEPEKTAAACRFEVKKLCDGFPVHVFLD